MNAQHCFLRYAVVTGSNKGIGFEVCRQLASSGIFVVLTARDEKKGLEALQKLKDCGVSGDLLGFHQLDVVDPHSVANLADFVKIHFGKLDILVNNAGISGIVYTPDNFRRGVELSGDWPVCDSILENFLKNYSTVQFLSIEYDSLLGLMVHKSCVHSMQPDGKEVRWNEMVSQNLDLAEQCLKTNYYGAKGMVEALAPLLQSSDSATIVNVSSGLGLLKNIPNQWAKGLLSDAENLSEERVDEVGKQFLKDFKEGLLEANGWPQYFSTYIVAKACMNAYTRVLAKKHPSFRINAVAPGFCKTDITLNLGSLTAAQGAEYVVRAALLPKDGPSGCLFNMQEMSSF
ncbi:hypothetical protein DM860_018127 [Cuscuta australis]|uniref:(+)-neomenthol dehydrogenase n=1 Tax=Cuscuta australis TaxID=267555 RepID=A0A328DUA6_9ASTE|nr:hypothetical protein DM860_018127 [Cuscuta australis]